MTTSPDMPQSETELAEIIQGAKGPLRIQGGGTHGLGRAQDQTVSTAGLSGIRLYEPGGLTLVAGAGTPVAEIDTILAQKGQRLGFEPMDYRNLMSTEGSPTLGGLAAANVSGPRRIQSGACRDFMLGIRMVDGQGNIIANGGRVMKNVTGYDMVKLMAGSFGTLGVLTEISMKVQAIPQAEATLVLRGQTMADACADLRAALGTPWDVTGACFVGAGISDGNRSDAPSQRLIRIEGMAGSVAYRAQCLRDRFGADTVLDTDQSRTLWAHIRDMRDFGPAVAQSAPAVAQSADQSDHAIWRISTTPSTAPVIHQTLRDAKLSHAIIADWAGGLIWLRTPATGDAGAAVIRPATDQHGGHATLIRAPEPIRRKIPVFHPQPAPVERLSAALRGQFDPRSILNPGLMEPLC